MQPLATRYASPLEPSTEQLAARVRDSKGTTGDPALTKATDSNGTNVVVGNPDLNPQFNYGGTNAATPAALSPLDQATKDYYEGLTRTTDPEAIRERVRKQMQGTLDATNSLYDELRKTQVNENTGQYNRVRGININSGLGGSDFGAANTNNAEEKGNAALALIDKQRATALSVVLGNIDSRSEAAVKDEVDTAKKNSVDYINYLKGNQDKAQADIKAIAASGVALEQLPKDKQDALIKQSGLDKFTFEQVYNNARTAATKIDYTYKTMGNQVIGYGKDPITGQIKTIETDLPFDTKEYEAKPEVLSNGTLIFTPKVLDPNKPIKDQLMIYKSGVPTKAPVTPAGKKPVVSGSLSVTQDEISQGVQILQNSKGEDGYVDPTLFKQMYDTWVKNGGKGQDFLTQYPVKQYVNPANSWLPTYLRPTAKATTKAPWE